MHTWKTLKNDALMHLSRRFGHSFAKPDVVSVNLTLRCNLSCSMCTTCYDSPELSLDEVKGIIDQTAAWGVEVFNPLGGEPFMRGDIEEILSYAVRRGFYVTVTTNGTLITKKRAELIATIPPDRLHFNFSLDGDERSNDAVRGQGMWKRAIEGYQRLRFADRQTGNSRRKILSNTILHAGNLHHFETILSEQESLGFDGVQILNLFRAGPETPVAGREMWFKEPDFYELEALSERLARKVEAYRGAGFKIQNTANELRNIPKYYQEDLKAFELPCWSGWKELYINADGQAIMCDGKLDFLNGAFGNVRSQSLKKLWGSSELKKRRAVVKTCKTPCAQKCYLRPASDSSTKIFARALSMGTTQAFKRLKKINPRWKPLPEAKLRIELSDVPLPSSGQSQLWKELTRKCPEQPGPESWSKYRDLGHLDFGRGFMGFDLLKRVVEDLHSSKLQFGTLVLGWRGEPLIHPEIEPILHYLFHKAKLGVFQRIRIESSGEYLTPTIQEISRNRIPQDWVFSIHSGMDIDPKIITLNRSDDVRVVLKAISTPEFDLGDLLKRYPSFAPFAGTYPNVNMGDVLWICRKDHTQYEDDLAAQVLLKRQAKAYSIPLGIKDRNGHCHGPERTPVISWDGKLTLCERDRQLENVFGEVNHDLFSDLWDSMDEVRTQCKSSGRPSRDFCRDCGFLWSPNGP